MAEKRKRSQNFTAEEKEKLVKLLLEHKNTILNKKTDGSTNEAKLLAWNQLTTSFNATGSVHRTKDSLMKVWDKLKSESKLYYSTTRRSASQTGGGPSIVKIDPILEQVCNIMGRGCSGIEGINDSDAAAEIILEATIHNVESLPKVLCIGEDLVEMKENMDCQEISKESIIHQTPIWSRRRPISTQMNERTTAVNTLCSSFKDINKKKKMLNL